MFCLTVLVFLARCVRVYCVCACVCVCVRVFVCACTCMRVRASVRVSVLHVYVLLACLRNVISNVNCPRSNPVSVMDEWLVENTLARVTKSGPSTLTVVIGGKRIKKEKPIYWVAPREYLGNKVVTLI